MKIVESGGIYNIYNGNKIKTYDELPVGIYEVCFHQQRGFWLEEHPCIEVKEEKIYGNHERKVKKVLDSFEMFNRNLGVMLSGDKGMGKSLFAKLFSLGALQRNYPIVLVNRYFPNVIDFINTIQQEIVVIFDEFDKTFKEMEDYDPQIEVLNILDGLSVGKKVFMMICNELDEINDCLLNRPGRIHYHFRFKYPDVQEVRQYLEDKLKEEYYNKIDEIIKFTYMCNINYDCLRAIAFEINNGYDFKETIDDLNILNLNEEESFKIVVTFKDNTRFSDVRTLTLSGNKNNQFWMQQESQELYVRFNSSSIEINTGMTNKDSHFASIDPLKIMGLNYNIFKELKSDEFEKLLRYYTNTQNIESIKLYKTNDYDLMHNYRFLL